MSTRVRHHDPPARDVPERDESIAARGFCGRIDEIGRHRCYRRANHPGACRYSRSFQLTQLDPPVGAQPRR